MNGKVRLSCDPEVLMLPVNRILPMRLLDEGVRKSAKYRCIEASMKEIGLIEPLVVFRQPDSAGGFMLLDGHIRLMIVKELGESTVKCLIASDDEGFTYNHKVNRLSAIQEHFMILRAIKSGVSETKIARSLHVNLSTIRQKRDMLDGICPEAVQLLKDRRTCGNAFRELRKVKPMRQIELAELMCAAGNFSVGYAKCLVASTPHEQMVDADRSRDVRGLSAEDVSRMEHEVATLGREFKLIEESHGRNVLNLVLVAGYLRKLLDNARVVRYLSQGHSEILTEFQKIAESRSLMEGTGGEA